MGSVTIFLFLLGSVLKWVAVLAAHRTQFLAYVASVSMAVLVVIMFFVAILFTTCVFDKILGWCI